MNAPETVFVRTDSGVILQRDVPHGVQDPESGDWSTHARQLWEEQLAKGALQIVDEPCVQVPNYDGSGYHWAIDTTADPKAKRAAKPKADGPDPADA